MGKIREINFLFLKMRLFFVDNQNGKIRLFFAGMEYYIIYKFGYREDYVYLRIMWEHYVDVESHCICRQINCNEQMGIT